MARPDEVAMVPLCVALAGAVVLAEVEEPWAPWVGVPLIVVGVLGIVLLFVALSDTTPVKYKYTRDTCPNSGKHPGESGAKGYKRRYGDADSDFHVAVCSECGYMSGPIDSWTDPEVGKAQHP